MKHDFTISHPVKTKTKSSKEKKKSALYIPANLKKKGKAVQTIFWAEANSVSLKKLAMNVPLVGIPSFFEFGKFIDEILSLIRLHKTENIVLIFLGSLGIVNKEDIQEKKDLGKPFFDLVGAIENLKKELDEKIKRSEKVEKSLSYFFYHSKNSLGHLLDNDREELVSEIQNVSQRNNQFFAKFKITSSNEKLINYLNIKSPTQFFLHYEEAIKEQEFKYKNDLYKWDYEKNKLIVTLPSHLKDLLFVGNDYYRIDEKIDANGKVTGKKLTLIKRTTLKELYPDAKPYLKDYYYKGFTNIPDNFKWRQEHLGYYNRYNKPIYVPQKGKIDNVLKMLKHIFGEQEIEHRKRKIKRFELALDYIQILITQPTQPLPILILFSKERETGKSTFPDFLKKILGTNAIKVGNKQFDSEFNEVFADKLLIWCDETLLDRKAQAEKIKDLSTSKTILVNPKGSGQYEIPFFGKFIFTSNNARMIYVDENSVRFWINKVPILKEDDPLFLEKLEKEIPALLHYLKNRKLLTKRETRMHFHNDLIKTEGLTETIRVNEPQDASNIREGIKKLFDIEENGDKIDMTLSSVINEFLRPNTNKAWVKEILTDYLKVDTVKNSKGKSKVIRSEYYRIEKEKKAIYKETKDDKGRVAGIEKTGQFEYVEAVVKINLHGRAYRFFKSDFLED